MQKSNSFKSQKPVIAIDGTAGSGKGTLAKKLANLIDKVDAPFYNGTGRYDESYLTYIKSWEAEDI